MAEPKEGSEKEVKMKQEPAVKKEKTEGILLDPERKSPRAAEVFSRSIWQG
jgi:hypothetical protein